MTCTPIPSSAEELTPAWLSRVLGAEVREVRILDAHSGTTGRVKLGLSADSSLPATLFAKIQPFDPKQRDYVRMIGMGVVEARFYAELGQDIPVRIPRVWHSSYDDAGDFVMLLEDLDGSGCRFPTADDPDAAEVAESVVAQLACLHSAFAGRTPEWLRDRALGASNDERHAARLGRLADIVQSALDQFGPEQPPEFRHLCQVFITRRQDLGALWNEGVRTLAHGDNHVRNLFLDGDRVGFYDWAVVCEAPGMRDVSYFITKMPTEVRRECQNELLARYRTSMAEGGVGLDQQTVDDQYRLFAVYSWMSAATTAAMGSAWHPASIGYESMQRATTAIIDLDVLDLLSQRLS